ncbi:hypothetical protein DFJ43DRAFT_1108490 [Lentinula guzmanii]|uniref:Uncharacterized protein n=1 Tax=Lentinula guzmanii TaxID=2804957 RepID=A0AA38J624_9AGAR|nr:hypothetical protein DFJ43DRAFT_1108490 [Lentinula guzmanii]
MLYPSLTISLTILLTNPSRSSRTPIRTRKLILMLRTWSPMLRMMIRILPRLPAGTKSFVELIRGTVIDSCNT